MNTTSEPMLGYYAARAPYYDEVYAKPERSADIAFLTTFLVERFAAREVFELACGTGYWTQHIASVAHRLVASDGLAEPLAIARQRPGCEAVEFRQLDAYALPDDLGRFDAAFAGLWFSHVPITRRGAFVRGLHAHLKPGARVVWIDNSDAQCRELPIAETDPEGNTWQHRRLRDGSVHRVLKNFPTEPELRTLLAGHARCFSYRKLDNFWLLEYELEGI